MVTDSPGATVGTVDEHGRCARGVGARIMVSTMLRSFATSIPTKTFVYCLTPRLLA